MVVLGLDEDRDLWGVGEGERAYAWPAERGIHRDLVDGSVQEEIVHLDGQNIAVDNFQTT